MYKNIKNNLIETRVDVRKINKIGFELRKVYRKPTPIHKHKKMKHLLAKEK